MYQYHCLNPISQIGLDKFTENYQKTEAAEAADAILVRSASMHEIELPENLKVPRGSTRHESCTNWISTARAIIQCSHLIQSRVRTAE